MPTVNFVNEKKKIEVPLGANLRQEAMKAGVQVYPWIHKYPLMHCPGLGCCGTCRVNITDGMDNAGEMGMCEKMRFRFSFCYIGNEETMRLSCQTTVQGDMDVATQPAMNWFGESFFS